MTKNCYRILCVLFLLSLMGRPSVGTAQTWVARDTIPMQAADGLFSFAIGGTVFVGGGNHRDFFAYDTLTHTFTRKADIPGVTTARAFPTGFAIADKGYLAFGFDGSVKPPYIKNDLWQYDPSTDKWTKKANCPGVPRDGAGAFVLNGKAYIGGGQDQNQIGLKDFYEYDPATDQWTQKADVGGGAIDFPATFAIGSYGYFATGGVGLSETARLYRYDVATDTWTKRTSFPGKPRQTAVGFSLGALGYVGLGQSAFTTAYDDFYSYDPKTDKWALVTTMPEAAGPRAWPTGTVCGNSVYIGTGWDLMASMFNDWWELSLPITPYTPTAHLTFASQYVDCGEAPAHTSIDTTVQLYSGSEASVTISSLAIDGSSAFSIKDKPKLPLTLTAGQVYPLTITFAPTSDSDYSATLTLISNAEGETSHQTTLDLSGQGIGGAAAHLTQSAASLVFNTIQPGAQAHLSDTLRAVAGDVHISSISITGTGMAAYSVNVLTLPYTVASGSELPLTITFAPSTSGTYDASVMVTSDAEGESAHSTTIAVHGVASSAAVAPESDNDGLTVTAAPNPFVRDLTLHYRLGTGVAQNFEVTIVDEAGRTIERLGTIQLKPGDQTIHLEPRALPVGHVRVVLQGERRTVSIPLVKE